jgi:hypothetical protein
MIRGAADDQINTAAECPLSGAATIHINSAIRK